MKPKTAKILSWIIIGLLSLQFVAAGLPKLTGDWATAFEKYGYPSFTMYLIGVIEILAVIGFYFSKSRRLSIMTLIVIMVGAAITHLLNDELGRIIQNGILITLLMSLLYLQKKAKSKPAELST